MDLRDEIQLKLEKIHGRIFLTQDDRAQIDKIRKEFENEVKVVEARYMQIELDYLLTSHKIKL